MKHRALEHPIVIRSGNRGELISRRFTGRLLQNLLQFSLGIVQIWDVRQFTEGIAKTPQDELPSRFKSSIEINCPDQRLESVRQGGLTLSSSAGFLAVTQNKMVPQPNSPRLISQSMAIDHLGAGLRQRPFTEPAEFRVKLVRQYQSEDRIAEEFQALIVRHAAG